MRPFLRFILLCFVLHVSVHCSAQEITSAFLQGTWVVEKILHNDDQPIVQEYVPPRPDDNIWIFEGDTLFRFFFPFQTEGKEKIKIDSGKLYRSANRYPFAYLRLDSGKLLASIRDGYTLRFKRAAITGDSAKVIGVLKRDSINPGMLLCSYTMVTHFEPDDEAAFDFKPPVKMAMTISFRDSAAARSAIRSGIVYIQAGGVLRPFHLGEIRWKRSFYEEGELFYPLLIPELVLYPGDWWTKESFQVIYRPKHADVWNLQKK